MKSEINKNIISGYKKMRELLTEANSDKTSPGEELELYKLCASILAWSSIKTQIDGLDVAVSASRSAHFKLIDRLKGGILKEINSFSDFDLDKWQYIDLCINMLIQTAAMLDKETIAKSLEEYMKIVKEYVGQYEQKD